MDIENTKDKAPLTVTLHRAVELTGLSVPTIYRLLASQKLSSVKVGRRRLIHYASIKDLMEAA